MLARSLSFCWLALTLLLTTTGCLPRVRVIPHPAPHDPGVRYYRPKPYLFLSPATVVTKSGTAPVDSGELVAIELKYLPDFSEEYSLDVRTGWGAANVQIELEDGWNLVSLNQDLDSKVDKNIAAMADLVEAIPKMGINAAGDESDSARIVVQSSNVPLGFYEAVVGQDRCGKKQLYGFRYVGFIPFANCPICPTGSESANCHDGTLALYGLVFEHGAMVFRPIGQVAGIEEPSRRVPIERLPAPQ